MPREAYKRGKLRLDIRVDVLHLRGANISQYQSIPDERCNILVLNPVPSRSVQPCIAPGARIELEIIAWDRSFDDFQGIDHVSNALEVCLISSVVFQVEKH